MKNCTDVFLMSFILPLFAALEHYPFNTHLLTLLLTVSAMYLMILEIHQISAHPTLLFHAQHWLSNEATNLQ